MKRICLGKIAGVHGVKGLVKFFPYGEDPTLLQTASAIYTSETGSETVKITLKNPQGKFILAAIDGVNSREDAQSLGWRELYISRDDLPEPEDGSFYYEDLKGLKVLDKTGTHIGKVINVDDFGAGDLLEIQPLSGKTYYVPFVDQYVLNTNLKDGTITIIPLIMDDEE